MKSGQVIDHYLVLRALGEGAFGAVFKVQDTRDGQIYALKVMKPRPGSKHLDPVKEARPLVAVQHPHIVNFRALHPMRDGSFAIVMDFAEGESLEAYCGKHPDLRVILTLLNQAAMGLDFAHSKGVAHRDIKPANILVTLVDGQPSALISDFGLGREEGYRLQDAIAMPAGSLAFLAPEAFMPAITVPPSVDRWALAVSAFNLLTDDYPFPFKRVGPDPEDVVPDFARQRDIRTFLPRAPEVVSQVFRKALQEDPGNRYQTCLDFTQALGAASGERLPTEPGTFAVTVTPLPLVDPLPPIPPGMKVRGDATFSFAVERLLDVLKHDLPNNREGTRTIAGVQVRWKVRAGTLTLGLMSRTPLGRVGDRDALAALGFAAPSGAGRDYSLTAALSGTNLRDIAERTMLGLVHGYQRSTVDVASFS